MKKNISKAVISRLPRYYRYLGEMSKLGKERVSSEELSSRMGLTASQIRQDFNNFGGFGHQGYGYNIEYLKEEIGKILGIDKPHNIAIVGVGNIGKALASSKAFEEKGFKVMYLFDNSEDIIGKDVYGLKVENLNNLEKILKSHKVEIGVISVPEESAKEIADRLIECGVKGIWNFAHIDLDLPKDVVVQNAHLIDSLMQISYNLQRQ